MTSYTVDWTSDAEDGLTQIWLQTYDPAVTSASNQIDRLLARDPFGHGQLAHEGLYKLTVPPLTAYYSIDQAHNTVEVSAVRYTP
ncbi:MAG TPA: type II toxin-antitoxin system RelE/ParE family toxin [Gemmataceae bacterium]|nr:type II toxin-antitoxin system RelE/ParE family toxin [Gemmataceae bacterium]